MGKLFSKILTTGTIALSFAAIPNLATAQAQDCSSYDQDFKVYFESNMAAATDIGNQVVEQAMENIKTAYHCKVTHIKIFGHTDRQGLTQKNEALSYAMGYYIAEALMDLGADPQLMEVKGFGETKLAKETEDGVSSPRNRRVEVSIKLADR